MMIDKGRSFLGYFKGFETKKIISILSILLFLLAVALLIWQMKQHKVLTNTKSARKAGMPIPVDTYKISRGKLDFFMPVECTAQATALIPVYSLNRYNEVVKKSYVKVNDQVKKGQLLVEMNSGMETLELESAENELKWLTKEADEGYEPYMNWAKRNLKKGYGIEREYQERRMDWLHARTLVEKAKFDVKLKRKQLEFKKIFSPVNGVVSKVAYAGQVTGSNDVSLVTIAVLDPILLECPVSEEKLNFIREGQWAEISFYSNNTQKQAGIVAYIEPIADAEQRSVSVFISLKNPKAKLLPGLHSIAQILGPKHALRIPNVAMITGSQVGKAQVFIVDAEQHAHIRVIETGVYANGYTEVIKGLKAGDQVVIAGQLMLRDNDRVNVISIANSDNNE